MVWLSASGEKDARSVLLHMGKDRHCTFCCCSSNGFDDLNANGIGYNQMRLSPITNLSKTVAVILWGAVLLGLSGLAHSEAFYPSPSTASWSRAMAAAASAQVYKPPVPAWPGAASSLVQISTSDLLQRQELERIVQLAAFQQFDRHKTGIIYDVSVAEIPSGNVRAVRLRSGSFKRYGITINEFTIPEGCVVDPFPERILLVYTRFSNTSLFQGVPAGYILASPVLSVLVYDAGNLNSSQIPRQISVSTTGLLISIRFPQNNGIECAYFADNTTAVNISDSVQGTCQSDHLGSFGAVRSRLAPAPAPTEGEAPSTARSRKHSNTWKIVVGSVVGGLVLLGLLTAAASGIRKRRKNAKLSRMEYQTEHGETLQMTTIRNSRVPTATNTRTQATLVNDYAV